ncbi:GntR family transcriptional regulator [Pseudonocardia eucalypti]|uniref:GntR family transcriptional regulator n=1 Tax=Pseudonocardia eucalypti TaxID=648755 RepID=A0ABP9QTU4_9PSEU|nr:DNA-binding GntR family transcriptional regulator [Pseudonocardia eucalypti]
MPKRYGVKDKDVAVAHIVSGLLDGSLRPGDRIDRTEIAATLGMSRVPVQEAVNQLERDGIVSIPYHRGVFLERFDADVVREHYEIYGMLSGIASARAAARGSDQLKGQLRELVDKMSGAPDQAEFENLVWDFRRAINQEVAGPRLRASIGTFQGFMPTAFWLACADNRTNHQSHMLPTYAEELAAIERGDAEGAKAIVVERCARMAETVNDELRRRGVFGWDGGPEPQDQVPKASEYTR